MRINTGPKPKKELIRLSQLDLGAVFELTSIPTHWTDCGKVSKSKYYLVVDCAYHAVGQRPVVALDTGKFRCLYDSYYVHHLRNAEVAINEN